jgi:hypothetical protein
MQLDFCRICRCKDLVISLILSSIPLPNGHRFLVTIFQVRCYVKSQKSAVKRWSAGTLFYLKNHIHWSLRLLVVVAGSTVLTTIPIYCEPAHFDSVYCLSIRFFLIIFKKMLEMFSFISQAHVISNTLYFWYVIPTRCTSHRVFSFHLITALHILGVVTIHPQEHKATASTASGKHYTVIVRVKFLIKSTDRLD